MIGFPKKNLLKKLMGNNKAFTIAELIIVITLLSVVILLGTSIFTLVYSTVDDGRVRVVAQGYTRTAGHFITNELKFATDVEIMEAMPSTPDTGSCYIYVSGNDLMMYEKGDITTVIDAGASGITEMNCVLEFQTKSEQIEGGAANIACFDFYAKRETRTFSQISSDISIKNVLEIINSVGAEKGAVIRFKNGSGDCRLTSYKLVIGGIDYLGEVDQIAKTVTVKVPLGTTLTGVAATFTSTGKYVWIGSTLQTSSETTNNFASPVVYTVEAENNNTNDYVITVVEQYPGAYVSLTFVTPTTSPIPEDLPTEDEELVGSYEYFDNGLGEEGISETVFCVYEEGVSSSEWEVLETDTLTYVPIDQEEKQIVFGVKPKSASGISAPDFIYSSPITIFSGEWWYAYQDYDSVAPGDEDFTYTHHQHILDNTLTGKQHIEMFVNPRDYDVLSYIGFADDDAAVISRNQLNLIVQYGETYVKVKSGSIWQRIETTGHGSEYGPATHYFLELFVNPTMSTPIYSAWITFSDGSRVQIGSSSNYFNTGSPSLDTIGQCFLMNDEGWETKELRVRKVAVDKYYFPFIQDTPANWTDADNNISISTAGLTGNFKIEFDTAPNDALHDPVDCKIGFTDKDKVCATEADLALILRYNTTPDATGYYFDVYKNGTGYTCDSKVYYRLISQRTYNRFHVEIIGHVEATDSKCKYDVWITPWAWEDNIEGGTPVKIANDYQHRYLSGNDIGKMLIPRPTTAPNNNVYVFDPEVSDDESYAP